MLWSKVDRFRGDRCGQASVEYALLLFGFLAIVVGLAALWRFASANGLVDAALDSASHSFEGGALAGLQDVLLFRLP